MPALELEVTKTMRATNEHVYYISSYEQVMLPVLCSSLNDQRSYVKKNIFRYILDEQRKIYESGIWTCDLWIWLLHDMTSYC